MIHLTDEELQNRAEGLLSTEKTGEVNQHLNTCTGCSEKLHRYSQLGTGLRNMNWAAQAPDIESTVMMRIMKFQRTSKSSGHFIVFMSILFMLLIAGSVAAFFAAFPMPHTYSIENIPVSSYRETLTSVIDSIITFCGYLFTPRANYVILAILSILLFVSLDLRKPGKKKSV